MQTTKLMSALLLSTLAACATQGTDASDEAALFRDKYYWVYMFEGNMAAVEANNLDDLNEVHSSEYIQQLIPGNYDIDQIPPLTQPVLVRGEIKRVNLTDAVPSLFLRGIYEVQGGTTTPDPTAEIYLMSDWGQARDGWISAWPVNLADSQVYQTSLANEAMTTAGSVLVSGAWVETPARSHEFVVYNTFNHVEPARF